MSEGLRALRMNQPIGLVNLLLFLGAIVLLIPIVVLFVECLAAALANRKLPSSALLSRPRIAVLVPAHNEASGIEGTLNALQSQLTNQDLLLVIADNCDDETATIARATGASVLERHNLEQRGKGYALDFGLNYLAADPPDVVVIVDADCIVAPGAIEKIACLAATQSRPVQATYLLNQPAKPKPKDAVSVLAFTVKNLVRPLGMAQLGFPCLLTGTGMAFPWSVIRKVSLASGNIVEDMQLALDLAIAGDPAIFCAEARVIGALPQQDRAARSQRTRWEHGHLQTLLTQVPRLLKAALHQKRADLVAVALDLSVPPLSLLVMLWGALMAIALLLSLLSNELTVSALLLAVEGILILTAVLVAWAKFSRADLPMTTLLSVPLYVLWKIPLYLAFLVKPQTKWVRTERDAIDSSKL